MSSNDADARYEDAAFADRPLRLRAESEEDLAVLSSLVQDAVARVGDISWLKRKHRLVLLLNRFRWEDVEAAAREGRANERVRAALTLDGVLAVRCRGMQPGEKDGVIAVLALAFEPGAEGAGRVYIRCAGGAEVCAEVECLDAALADLTRPWEAQAAGAPRHEE